MNELLRGRTALIVAHRFSTIEQSRKIAVIDAGRLVDAGSPAELLTRDSYYKRLRELHGSAMDTRS